MAKDSVAKRGSFNTLLESQFAYEGCPVWSQYADSAEFNLRVRAPLKSEPLNLGIKLQQADGHWQIVAVEYLDE